MVDPLDSDEIVAPTEGGRVRSIAPHRQALEDQILAILGDADLPLRPGQIAAALGPQPLVVPCQCRCGDDHHRTVMRTLWNSDLTPLLRRLERKGQVERFVVPRGPMNPTGAHYWRAAEGVE